MISSLNIFVFGIKGSDKAYCCFSYVMYIYIYILYVCILKLKLYLM